MYLNRAPPGYECGLEFSTHQRILTMCCHLGFISRIYLCNSRFTCDIAPSRSEMSMNTLATSQDAMNVDDLLLIVDTEEAGQGVLVVA